jgi:hypothetical protein
MLECLVTASPQGDNYWKMGKREIVSSDPHVTSFLVGRVVNVIYIQQPLS